MRNVLLFCMKILISRIKEHDTILYEYSYRNIILYKHSHRSVTNLQGLRFNKRVVY